ncbi:hypothetical protein ACH40D_21325 [Streptomyces olivaceoviridis]|uniref:Uncharacterized protein n=1 Tax=Streptomyces olivaceoviridis TaxID=1921 RepID=A0ABW7VN12_STROI|nr:hypothetical protein [Streptomyces corchorusii]
MTPTAQPHATDHINPPENTLHRITTAPVAPIPARSRWAVAALRTGRRVAQPPGGGQRGADAVIPGITRRHRAQSVVAARQPYPVG